MLRATGWTTLLGLALPLPMLFGQAGNAGTRQAPGSGGPNAGTRQAPGGGPNTPQVGGNAGTRQIPGSGPINAGSRVVPGNWDPGNAATRVIPGEQWGAFGGGGLTYGGAAPGDLLIGQVTNGYVLPAAGNGSLFVGTRQPFVLAAPSVFGGPVYIQQPRFFENTVIGGVGGVVSGGTFSRNGFGQRVEGGQFGGVGIGPGGVAGFNNAWASGINIGINGGAKLGNNGGFVNFQAGPRAAGGPAAGNLGGRFNAGGGNIGFNATGFQAAGRERFAVLPAVPGPVIIGGGPGATMTNLNPAVGTAPGFGNAERLPKDDGRLSGAEFRRLHSPPSMMYWMQEMWKAPVTAGFTADLDKRKREQLFVSTLQLLDESVADGAPVKLSDGATLQLVRPTSMVYTSPDGKSSTGWLKGQDMPDVFGLVAVQLYRATQAGK